jgi:hypothetical protein
METELIDCPHCQQPTPFAATSVLMQGDAVIHELLDGTLNRCVCKACEKAFLFETPLLYRDDERRYIVYYVPPAFAASEEEAIKHVDQLYNSIFGDFSTEERPLCRLVTSRSQLIEKIVVHQGNYDDRLIEYIKYQLLEHSPGLDVVRHELLFDFGNSSDKSIQFLVFDRETRQPQFSLQFSPEDYEGLAAYFLEEGRDELDSLFKPYLVRVEDLIY